MLGCDTASDLKIQAETLSCLKPHEAKNRLLPGIESCWSITPQITSDVGDQVDEYTTINLDIKHFNSVILIHEVNYIFAFQPLYCHFISAVTRNVIYIFILYIHVNPNLVIYSDRLHAALRETLIVNQDWNWAVIDCKYMFQQNIFSKNTRIWYRTSMNVNL